MRRLYCCDASRGMYEEYYTRQQKGNGMPVYVGASSQRGHGLGNMLGSMFRRILPYLQRGASAALRTGAQVFDDVRDGKTIKDSLIDRVPGTIKSFASSIVNQSGSGAHKRRKSLKRRKAVRRSSKRKVKKRRTDVL